MSDTYEDQLSAARYKAERDQARQELARLKDRSRDTTVSAYDLLPKEDREALRCVRGHGGLDEVRRDFQDAYNRRSELCAALGIDLDTGWGDAMAELARRLMPEGMEWPLYESGEPVAFGDEVTKDGEEFGVSVFEMISDGSYALNFRSYSKGERVKRPGPKVLDADGVEIRVGDVLYSIETGDSVTVDSIEPGNPWFATTAGALQHCAKFTHRRPVLDADGAEIREGDTVYDVENGTEYEVCEVKLPRVTVEYWCAGISAHSSIVPSLLTHRAPVFAADGKPLREGETVWEVETGDEYVVERTYSGTTEPDFPGHTVACLRPDDVVTHMFKPSQLTHERPDSWERIEEDARLKPSEYADRYRIGRIGFEAEDMRVDLVRRCRALAERGE